MTKSEKSTKSSKNSRKPSKSTRSSSTGSKTASESSSKKPSTKSSKSVSKSVSKSESKKSNADKPLVPPGRSCFAAKKIQLPFLASLEPDTMKIGQSFFIKGLVDENAQAIDISLASGREVAGDNLLRNELPGCNVLLRIQVKFDAKKFVFTSFNSKNLNKGWEKEETADLNITPGKEFDLRIRAVDYSYEIWSQGVRVFKYAYKGAQSATSHILVDGSMELNRFTWEGTYYENPIDVQLGQVFEPGQAIYIAGVVKKPRESFTIELKDEKDRSMFVLKVDFVKKAVSGSIAYLPQFPFQVGHCFDILLKFDHAGLYPVYVDGKYLSKKLNRAEAVWKAVKEKKEVKPKNMFIQGEIEIHAIRV